MRVPLPFLNTQHETRNTCLYHATIPRVKPRQMRQEDPQAEHDTPREQTLVAWLTSGFFLYLRVCLACAVVVAAISIAAMQDWPAHRRVRAIVLLCSGGGILYLCCREFEKLVGRLPDAARWWLRHLGREGDRDSGPTAPPP